MDVAGIRPRNRPLTDRWSMVISAPDRTEFADSYLPYVEKIAGDDVMNVMSHVNDTERLFSFRAFWFARAISRQSWIALRGRVGGTDPARRPSAGFGE